MRSQSPYSGIATAAGSNSTPAIVNNIFNASISCLHSGFCAPRSAPRRQRPVARGFPFSGSRPWSKQQPDQSSERQLFEAAAPQPPAAGPLPMRPMRCQANPWRPSFKSAHNGRSGGRSRSSLCRRCGGDNGFTGGVGSRRRRRIGPGQLGLPVASAADGFCCTAEQLRRLLVALADQLHRVAHATMGIEFFEIGLRHADASVRSGLADRPRARWSRECRSRECSAPSSACPPDCPAPAERSCHRASRSDS